MTAVKRRAAILTGGWLLVACLMWDSAELSAQIRAGINYASGVITFLQTPSSANLFSALTDETGSGLAVGSIAPTFNKLTSEVAGIGAADFAAADDGVALSNSTAGTGGTTVQASPNLRFRGHSFFSAADHLHDVVTTLSPSTANGIDNRPGSYLKWMSSTDSGTYYEQMRLSQNGNLLTASGIDAGYCVELADGRSGTCQGDVTASYNGLFWWRGQSSPTALRFGFASTSPGLLRMYGEVTGARKIEISVGSAQPALSSCGTNPTLPSDATNAVGSLATAADTSACTITWGAPQWAATPKCMVIDVTSNPNALLRITSASASAMTFTVGASKTVWWHCFGNGL